MNMNKTIIKLKNQILAYKNRLTKWFQQMIQAWKSGSQSHKGSSRSGSWWNKLIHALSFHRLLLPLGVLAIGFALFFFMKNPFNIDWGLNKIETQTSFVVEEIKNISDFTTAAYYEEQLKERTKEVSQEFWDWKYNTKTHVLSLVIKGTVKIGFDLSNMTNSDVTFESDNTLIVKLPVPEMQEPIINPSDIIIVFGGDDSAFTDEDKREMIKEAKEALKQNAIKEGVFEKAKEQGIKEITNLLNALGFDKVKVVVKDN